MRESTHKYLSNYYHVAKSDNQSLQNNIDKPSFATIWWDSAKTTASYTGGPLVTITLFPLAMFFKDIPWLDWTWSLGRYTVGIVGAALFSLPFALATQGSRQYKSNNEIDNVLSKINTFDKSERDYLVKIIEKYDKTLERGIRSSESADLIDTFSSWETSYKDRWKTLVSYLSEKSYDNKAYVNNGKKLYNRILDVINPIINVKSEQQLFSQKTNNAIPDEKINLSQIKIELNNLITILNSVSWLSQGSGFFHSHLPKGIAKLQIKLIPLKDKLDSLSPQFIMDLSKHIKTMDFGENHFFRNGKTQKLYTLAKNLGSNNLDDFSDLIKFAKPEEEHYKYLR